MLRRTLNTRAATWHLTRLTRPPAISRLARGLRAPQHCQARAQPFAQPFSTAGKEPPSEDAEAAAQKTEEQAAGSEHYEKGQPSESQAKSDAKSDAGSDAVEGAGGQKREQEKATRRERQEGEQDAVEQFRDWKKHNRTEGGPDVALERKAREMRLGDQKALAWQQMAVGSKALELHKKEISEIQAVVEEQIVKEKEQYQAQLARLEELTAKDANRRVFAVVPELADVQKEEQAFLDEQVRRRRGQGQGDQPNSQQEYDTDVQRKELLVKQANLSPKLGLDAVKEHVTRFKSLPEEQRRDIYTSIRIGQAQQLAKAELLRYEIDPSKGEKLVGYQEVARTYDSLLKLVLPKGFLGEFLSLEEIQSKKEDAEQAFDDALEQFKAKSEKLKAQQEKIREYQAYMMEYENAQKAAASVGMGIRDLVSYEVFKEKLDSICGMKEILKEADLIEKENVPATASERESERGNQRAQREAEYDVTQEKNLLQLVLNMKEDMARKLKQLQIESAERQAAAFSADGQPDEAVVLDPERLFKETTSEDRRQEVLELLRKYKVDPEWLRRQQSSKLQQFIEENNRKLYERAKEVEADLLLGEHAGLSQLIHQHASSAELKQYLLQRLKSHAFASRASGAQSSQDQFLHDAIVAELENSLSSLSKDGRDAGSFDLTGYLMAKLELQDRERARPSPPINSTLEAPVHPWRAGNAMDQGEEPESLSYRQYRFRQLYQLHQMEEEPEAEEGPGAAASEAQLEDEEPSLFSRMPLAKRVAWHSIYNEYLRRQQQAGEHDGQRQKGQPKEEGRAPVASTEREFLELFRGWESRALVEGLPQEAQDVARVAMRGGAGGAAASARLEELLEEHSREPELGGRYLRPALFWSETAPPIEIGEEPQQAFEAIAVTEQVLAAMKEDRLERGAKHMYDKDALDQAEIEEYDTALKELVEAKEEFERDFGVAFERYSPRADRGDPDEAISADVLHRVGYHAPEAQPKLDRSFAAQKRLEAYKKQYPEDAEIDLIKFEQIELDPVTQAEVDEWLYNQRLREKYEWLYAYEQGRIPDEEEALEGDLWVRRGHEMDDELVRRIQLYLNENHERDYMVSRDFEHELLHEKEPTAQSFDAERYEAAKQEAKKAGLGDYARQQELIFELKVQQTKAEQALQATPEAAGRAARRGSDASSSKMQGMDPAQRRAREQRNRAELETHQKLLKEAIAAVAKGDRAQRAALEKAMMPGGTPGQAAGEVDASLLSAQIKVHEKVLEEHRKRGTDPISMLKREIMDEHAQRGAAVSAAADPSNQRPHAELLEKYFLLDSFRAAKVQPSQAPTQGGTTSSGATRPAAQSSLAKDLEKGLILSEDAALQQMAASYCEFDMEALTQALPLPGIAYFGAAEPPKAAWDDYSAAKSSDQVIEAAQTQTLSPWQERLAHLYDPQNGLREAYLRAKYQMFVNERLRQDLAARILQAKGALRAATESREAFSLGAQQKFQKYASAVVPKKAHDFLADGADKEAGSKAGVQDIMNRLKKFDPVSKDVQNYNDELHLQNRLMRQAKDDDTRSLVAQQQEYILQQMTKNGVRPDGESHALLFEKNVADDQLTLANQNLRSLLADGDLTAPSHPIPADSLRQFFDSSLSQDNYDGLAFLINYVEQSGVDISEWDMLRFRSGLDFYLNHTFNISKVLTFTRFYAHHVRCALQSESMVANLQNLETLSEPNLALLHREVFGQVEDLVDMQSLFGHLVDRIGRKALIDPLSQVDPIVNLIDLFARHDVKKISRHSEQGTTFLSDDDIVAYIVNHLDEPGAFKDFSKFVIKFDDNDYFTAKLIQALKEHQVKHGGLPKSLSPGNVKKFYLHVKGVVASQGEDGANGDVKVSEKTAELFLYLFRANSMVAESVDLCQNFDRMVRGSAGPASSEIRNYYMSDALLQVPLGEDQAGQRQHYYSLLEGAVYESADSAASAAHLVSMTKAYLKDGNVDHALKFFEEGLQRRRQISQEQDDALVKMFDATFGLDSQSERDTFSPETFAARFYNLMAARQRLKREAHLVQLLDSILERCDADEIDHVFSLQAVLREEQQILRNLSAVSPADYGHLYAEYDRLGAEEEAIHQFVEQHFKGPEQEQPATQATGSKQNARSGPSREDWVQRIGGELAAVRARRYVLESKLQYGNLLKLKKLVAEASDEKLDLLDRVTDIDKTMEKLGLSKETRAGLSKYEFEEEAVNEALEALRLENDEAANEQLEGLHRAALRAFKTSVKESTELGLEAAEAVQELAAAEYAAGGAPPLLAAFAEAHPEHQDIEELIAEAAVGGDGAQTPEAVEALRAYARFLYEAPLPEEPGEEEHIEQEIYGAAQEQYAEELKTVVAARRARVLPHAIATFNKIQNKDLPLWLQPEGELNAEYRARARAGADVSPGVPIPVSATSSAADTKTNWRNKRDDDPQAVRAQQAARYAVANSRLVDPSRINETIERYQYLLSDPTSPVLSNFLALLDYRDGRDFMDIEEFHEEFEAIGASSPQHEQMRHPLRIFLRQAEKLKTLCEELDRMTAVSAEMRAHIAQKSEALEDELRGAQKHESQYASRKEESLKKVINQHVRDLYSKFLDQQKLKAKLELGGKPLAEQDFMEYLDEEPTITDADGKASNFLPRAMTRDEKISIMKQALALEVGGYQPIDVFNSFYAEDLIAFGMENHIPVAVRLGEKMFSESGKSIPPVLASSIKNYKLYHSSTYQDAMKKTGPIDTARAYRSSKLRAGPHDRFSRSSIVSLDDPYWSEYYERNFRAQDQFRLPSALAWDHKQDGIVGEVVDLKTLRKNAEEARKLL